MSGWIKLHRKITDSPYWKSEPFSRGQAWVDMLLIANFESGFIRKQGIRVDLERGDIGWSEVELSVRWKWSRGKVRRFLEELENDSMICRKNGKETDRRKFVITILNYDKYQESQTGDGTSDGQATGQATGQEEELKKNKEEEKKKIVGQGSHNVIPYKDVINYLNDKAGTSFKATTSSTKNLIKARWNEGYRKEDFFQVIDRKKEEWGTDFTMVQYLRPQTLFGTKFESYLQTPSAPKKQKGPCSECIHKLAPNCRNKDEQVRAECTYFEAVKA